MPVTKPIAGRGGLLRQHDFRHLWAADVISQFGTRVSYLALPLLAVTYLHASTIEVSLLRTAQTLAYLVLGLQAGAWCDRMRRRPVIIAADLGRAALLCWIPLGAALGVLTVWQLYVVVAAAGVLSLFFDVAWQSYLPALVSSADLVQANTRLAGNSSVAAIAAPVAGGLLVQWLGAPLTVGLDAASFLFSGLWVRAIRARETAPVRPPRRHLSREIGEGLALVARHPILRAMAAHSATLSLCQSANGAILVVFLVRQVHLSAGVIGALGSVGLLGALVATVATRVATAWLGQARLLWMAGVLGGVGFLLYPLVAPGWWLLFEVAGTFLASVAVIVLIIVETSFQQAVCPPALLGRLNATMHFVVWGAIPVGSVLGGVAGALAGLRATLWIAGGGALAAAGWLVCSPLLHLRDMPGTEITHEPVNEH